MVRLGRPSSALTGGADATEGLGSAGGSSEGGALPQSLLLRITERNREERLPGAALVRERRTTGPRGGEDLRREEAPVRRRAVAARIAMRGPQLVAEPNALTNSFVGTEEYLSPEVINAEGHTAAVDWWEFGILIYEMIFGSTPFRGSRREVTFDNVLRAPLAFPDTGADLTGGCPASQSCRALITRCLTRDVAQRIGASRGAEEIKAHIWFTGVIWALQRHAEPPFVPADGPGWQQGRTVTST